MASHRTGLLIIRAWIEEGSAQPLRAQIRVTDDVTTGMDTQFTLVQSTAVGELVDAWLRDVLRTAPSGPRP